MSWLGVAALTVGAEADRRALSSAGEEEAAQRVNVLRTSAIEIATELGSTS
jgi:hypothetical protein